jgi:hypothetical protein
MNRGMKKEKIISKLVAICRNCQICPTDKSSQQPTNDQLLMINDTLNSKI